MSDLVAKLPRIPVIMKRRGWATAAALMQRWFDGPPSDNRSAQIPDTTDVKMDWVLGFERAKKVYDLLVRDRIWSNFASRLEISHMLQGRARVATAAGPFGNLNSSVVSVNKNYINERAVVSSPLSDPLDDLFGALGSFNFRVAVEGKMAPVQPSGWDISIEKVGIYVHDSYDFQDDHWYSQPLGFWSFDGAGDVSKLPGLHSYAVANSSFRDYRAAKRHGGDFWVYSNLKVLNLYPPERFVANI